MTRFRTLAFAVALTGGATSAALADEPGPDWMSAEQVKEKVLKSGYTGVAEIKADKDHWRGEGVKNGQKMEFFVDPKTGALVIEKPVVE
ncbi:PepSY domain-containing protein [Hansschlegelia sp.]|uniref:PepSY domain-containing protein n=1 Tax=Hansschlegelia sp. TaxID=2041892 RepID=UPI002BD3A72E|nr:PepSY domain-containing protein [Hansschlegelia sp.]HVI27720.1 PepSY domain-containing protein [Hansschlegelia sp.]